MTFNKTLLTATMLTLGGFAAMSANAADSSDFGVTLQVTSSCSILASGGAIAFTSQKAATAVNDTLATSAGNIAVTCSKDAPYVINLTSKNAASATGTGKMTNLTDPLTNPATNIVTYQLFSDALGTLPWGNDGAVGAVKTGVAGTGAGLSVAAENHKVYARLTSTTDVLLGSYSDIVTASIVY